MIKSELESGKFSIINFYKRRARRILPALFFLMVVTYVFALNWLLPSDLRDFSQSLIAASLFASNILFWLEANYFDSSAELKPLIHTWSLSVGEQYYFIFPMLMMMIWSQKKIILLVLVIIATSSFLIAN